MEFKYLNVLSLLDFVVHSWPDDISILSAKGAADIYSKYKIYNYLFPSLF